MEGYRVQIIPENPQDKPMADQLSKCMQYLIDNPTQLEYMIKLIELKDKMDNQIP